MGFFDTKNGGVIIVTRILVERNVSGTENIVTRISKTHALKKSKPASMDDFEIMDEYYRLQSTGLYSGDGFWCRLARHVDMPRCELKYHIGYLLTLGPRLETFEERYFNDYGHHYEDYCVNTYEEDVAAGLVGTGEEEEEEEVEEPYY